MIEDRLRRLWTAAVILLAGAIAVGSLVPQPVVPVETWSDKVAHYLAYLSLALLGSGISPPERLARAILRCFVFGAVIELAQAAATAERAAEWGDLAANSAGILTAWLIAGGGRAGWAYRAAAWWSNRRSS